MTSFELFFALPNLILKHIHEFGIEINDDLSEVEKLIQQFDDVDLSAELDQLQRQGLKARNKLVSGYFRSVLKFVRNNFIERDELHSYYLDLVQEGALGLMTAADKYDYRNSGRFINYGITWIWQTTGRSAFEMNRNIRIPVHRSESLSQLEDVYEICLENEGHTSPELLALYLDYFDPEEKKKKYVSI
ncbi:MAG: hypothetical protein H6633_12745 [Anaerolineales bacterium]|nr:hypothetical protein [Anaerolineales bacterium]